MAQLSYAQTWMQLIDGAFQVYSKEFLTFNVYKYTLYFHLILIIHFSNFCVGSSSEKRSTQWCCSKLQVATSNVNEMHH